MIAGGRTSKAAFTLGLVILAACGVVLIRETTQDCPGLYIEMTHYPPFYSLALGGFEALGLSAPRTARLIWINSPTIAYVKAASADTIYTNDINALYLAANKASCSIPTRHSVSGLEAMRSTVRQSPDSLLVIFTPLTAEFAAAEDLTLGFRIIERFYDGEIYKMSRP